MRRGRWEIVEELGRGGQGVASLVFDSDKIDVDRLVPEIWNVFMRLTAPVIPAEQQRAYTLELLGGIEKYLGRNGPLNCAVLKLLHPHLLRDDKAHRRLETEVRLLSTLNHSSLTKVLDSQIDQGWFVTPYYSEGTLASTLHRFAGKPVEALRAFRSLVEGVAELHRRAIVHRDIKPENIFVEGDRLILGDFGIAYVDDSGQTRVSDTYENVGSRDWMPAWAMGMRLEDIRPSFDLFSLGKVLWAMVSGRTKMRLWYWDRSEFNLQEQFPTDDRVPWINQLLRGSVQENEDDIGWRDAEGLLKQCDAVLTILQRGGQVFAKGVNRVCRVCGNGIYGFAVREGSPTALRNLGFDPAGEKLRVLQCSNCGHLEIFRVTSNPPAWREIDDAR